MTAWEIHERIHERARQLAHTSWCLLDLIRADVDDERLKLVCEMMDECSTILEGNTTELESHGQRRTGGITNGIGLVCGDACSDSAEK